MSIAFSFYRLFIFSNDFKCYVINTKSHFTWSPGRMLALDDFFSKWCFNFTLDVTKIDEHHILDYMHFLQSNLSIHL